MSIEDGRSTNPGTLAVWGRHAAALLAVTAALLAAMPAAAEEEDGDDITISWEWAEYSVHEGDLLAVVAVLSKAVPQSMIDEQVTPPEWYLTVPVTRTDQGGGSQQRD